MEERNRTLTIINSRLEKGIDICNSRFFCPIIRSLVCISQIPLMAVKSNSYSPKLQKSINKITTNYYLFLTNLILF